MKRILGLLAVVIFCGVAYAEEEEKGFGFVYSEDVVFRCEPEDVLPDLTCRTVPSEEKMFMTIPIVQAIACKGPAHKAGLLVGDHLISIGGTKVDGLSLAGFNELLTLEKKKPVSEWVVMRPTGNGAAEKKTLTLVPGTFGEDFSCGKNENI